MVAVLPKTHDDVIKWKHFLRYWPFVRGIHRSPVNSPLKGQWRRALILSLICVWISGWVNNREAGNLRRYHAHYDVSVMRCKVILLKTEFRNLTQTSIPLDAIEADRRTCVSKLDHYLFIKLPSPFLPQAIIWNSTDLISLNVTWTVRNKFQWNLNQNTEQIFFRENTFENCLQNGGYFPSTLIVLTTDTDVE